MNWKNLWLPGMMRALIVVTVLVLGTHCEKPMHYYMPSDQMPKAPTDGECENGLCRLVTDNFTQTGYTESYDFLWVIDNSDSMDNIRDFMSQNLTQFVSILESRRQLDWQMAVTTTDHASWGGKLVGAGGTEVVKKDMAGVSGVWNQLVKNIPTDAITRGWEQGLESARSAIELYGSTFMRPSTPLVVAYVTDEQDYSCQGNCAFTTKLPEEFSDWVAFPTNRYVDHLRSLKARQNTDVLAYPIVHLKPLGQAGSCDDDYGFVGSRYMTVQQALQTGESLSICQQHLVESFNKVAQGTADRVACFVLTHNAADNGALVVSLDGRAVPLSADQGYTFEPGKNQVCFWGSYTPNNGQTIKVDYYTPDP